MLFCTHHSKQLDNIHMVHQLKSLQNSDFAERLITKLKALKLMNHVNIVKLFTMVSAE